MPTPTLVTIVIELLGINFVADFFRAFLDINFLGIILKTISSIRSDDCSQGIEPSQNSILFVAGVPPPINVWAKSPNFRCSQVIVLNIKGRKINL